MSKKDRFTIASIIAHRVAGNGVRQTAKLCGVSPTTVMRLTLLVGAGCRHLFDRMLRGIYVLRLELDELHTYLHTRQRKLRLDAPPEHGDTWGYLALDVPSRAIVTYVIGKRVRKTTHAFIHELRARVVGTPDISTDGHSAYLGAIAREFREGANYTQVVKEYESGKGPRGLRVADMYVSSTKIPMLGQPNEENASTSHVERFNGIFRAGISKFSRLTLRSGKSLPHLEADVSTFIAYYNLVHIHSTLRMTPGQALGITDHAWSLMELIDAALAEPEPPQLVQPVTETPRAKTKAKVKAPRSDWGGVKIQTSAELVSALAAGDANAAAPAEGTPGVGDVAATLSDQSPHAARRVSEKSTSSVVAVTASATTHAVEATNARLRERLRAWRINRSAPDSGSRYGTQSSHECVQESIDAVASVVVAGVVNERTDLFDRSAPAPATSCTLVDVQGDTAEDDITNDDRGLGINDDRLAGAHGKEELADIEQSGLALCPLRAGEEK